MKKTALLVAALVAGVSAQAQDSANALSFTLDNTVASEYIFRGEEFGDFTFHPSLEAAYGDFYAGVWGALSEDSAVDEIDYYAGYGFALDDNWSLDVGVTYYYYSGDSADSSIEPYIGVSGDVAGFSTSLYGYYDFDREATTVQASAGYSVPVEAIGSSLDFTATLGYVDINDGEEYLYYGIGASVPYKISENATFTVGVNFSDVDENVVNDGAEIVWTAGLSVGF